jgi:hypothetical protein
MGACSHPRTKFSRGEWFKDTKPTFPDLGKDLEVEPSFEGVETGNSLL